MTARAVVARVVDPELPMLTLDDLGVVRSVEARAGGVRVTIPPPYAGCPAVEGQRARRYEVRAYRHDRAVAHGARAGVEHRLDQRRRPPQARRCGCGPTRR